MQIRRASIIIVFSCVFFAEIFDASGQTIPCSSYLNSFTNNARLSFSYGYLEGIEAAITKDVVDVLVPPSHINHPIRWVLPEGVTSYKSLTEKLVAACRNQPVENIVRAAISIAERKEGRPEVGAWIDKETGKLSIKDQEKWRRFMGDAVPCKDYIKSPIETRNAIISGYFVGTEVYRIAMNEPANSPSLAWPIGIDTNTVRSLLDNGCQDSKEKENGDIRAGLWVITLQLSVKPNAKSK